MGKTFSTGNLTNGVFQDTSNNIGIGGAPSGSYKFDVTGTGRFTGDLTANGVTIGASDIRSSSNVLTLGGTSEVMRITGGGNVLIGTSSDPGYNLYVYGDNGIGIERSGNGKRQIYMGSNDLVFYNTTNIPYLSSAGVWINASDISIKKEITNIKYGLSDLLKLKPRSYKMKFDDLEQIGFIAQEVNEVIPEVIGKNDKFSNQMGLSYGNLLALAVKSIQELEARLKTLENK